MSNVTNSLNRNYEFCLKTPSVATCHFYVSMATMRDINLGTCATIVGTTTAGTPSPQAMLRFAYATQQVQGIYVFQHCLGEGGALGSGERGTWERIDSFFKSSKDLLHYSMLFLEMPQVFLTSIVG